MARDDWELLGSSVPAQQSSTLIGLTRRASPHLPSRTSATRQRFRKQRKSQARLEAAWCHNAGSGLSSIGNSVAPYIINMGASTYFSNFIVQAKDPLKLDDAPTSDENSSRNCRPCNIKRGTR